MPERESHQPQPVEASTIADMDEQVGFLREAFASNEPNALGVVNMEIARQQKIADGLHVDERLRTDDERAKAAYRLEGYRKLKAEFERTNT